MKGAELLVRIQVRYIVRLTDSVIWFTLSIEGPLMAP